MTVQQVVDDPTKSKRNIVAIVGGTIAFLALSAFIFLIVTRDEYRLEEIENQAEPMSMDNVVRMLIDDGMSIHTTAPRESAPFTQESSEIIFNDFELESTPPTFGRIEGMIHTFADLEARDSWLEISTNFGGYAVVRGEELWVVSVDSDLSDSNEIAQRLADSINAEVAG